MKAIVYTSETGHTAQYAQLLSKKTGLPAHSLADAKRQLPQGTEIFYLGWLMAGSAKGYSDAAKHFCVRGIALVGMSVSPNGNLWDKAVQGGGTVDGARVFYLQGGYAPEKLPFLYRTIMKTMEKTMGKALSAKDSPTPEDLDMLDLLQKGGTRVNEEHLAKILAWFSQTGDRP